MELSMPEPRWRDYLDDALHIDHATELDREAERLVQAWRTAD